LAHIGQHVEQLTFLGVNDTDSLSGTPFGVTLYTSLGKDRLLIEVSKLIEHTIDDRRRPTL
jgi:hypothetical protein